MLAPRLSSVKVKSAAAEFVVTANERLATAEIVASADITWVCSDAVQLRLAVPLGAKCSPVVAKSIRILLVWNANPRSSVSSGFCGGPWAALIEYLPLEVSNPSAERK